MEILFLRRPYRRGIRASVPAPERSFDLVPIYCCKWKEGWLQDSTSFVIALLALVLFGYGAVLSQSLLNSKILERSDIWR